jgi:hypothetical protein
MLSELGMSKEARHGVRHCSRLSVTRRITTIKPQYQILPIIRLTSHRKAFTQKTQKG